MSAGVIEPLTAHSLSAVTPSELCTSCSKLLRRLIFPRDALDLRASILRNRTEPCGGLELAAPRSQQSGPDIRAYAAQFVACA